jgi:hypothetical protein
MEKTEETKSKLRADLTPEEKAAALKIGRIAFKSAGATRKQ